MNVAVPHIILDHTFWLSSEHCIFWEDKKILIITDLHLGKTGHFRKSGIGVPQSVYKEDLHKLFALIQHYKPEQLIIVGDMFHSVANKEMDFFVRWRNDVSALSIELIKGNHDILHMDFYKTAQIGISNSSMELDSFSFIHDHTTIPDHTFKLHYHFTGHLHPGISIRSGSRQSLSFPCYYFGEQFCVLPAFSKFTGFVPIKPKPHDIVYAIMPANPSKGEYGAVIPINGFLPKGKNKRSC
jgi:DNA ligase-associated metallophosphoesterase